MDGVRGACLEADAPSSRQATMRAYRLRLEWRMSKAMKIDTATIKKKRLAEDIQATCTDMKTDVSLHS
jgi:hypothetical protein